MGRRPSLSREAKFSGANGDREKIIFPVQLTASSRIGNRTRLINTLLKALTIYTVALNVVFPPKTHG